MEALLIPHIDGLFLGDMLLQMRVLAPNHTGDHVAHAVVVAQFLMLVPRCVLPGLGGPLARLVCRMQIIRQQHAAGGAGDDLIAVEADAR